MKKWFSVIAVGLLLMISGCSLLNEATNTVTYIKEATEFLGKTTKFANDAPKLAQKAVNDPNAAKELEKMLLAMKEDMDAFNGLTAPEVAADLHQQIISNNTTIAQGIDLYLANIKNGKLDPSILENTELFQTVQDISTIIDQIKQLGQ
ncbi:DUF6376 family protein [Pseudoneobacillus sp. C159]